MGCLRERLKNLPYAPVFKLFVNHIWWLSIIFFCTMDYLRVHTFRWTRFRILSHPQTWNNETVICQLLLRSNSWTFPPRLTERLNCLPNTGEYLLIYMRACIHSSHSPLFPEFVSRTWTLWSFNEAVFFYNDGDIY